jgi:hypothetical protein
MVGIVDEDDLDAPDIVEPSQAKSPEPGPSLPRRSVYGTVHKPHQQPVLDPIHSQQLRDQLLTEISGPTEDGLALWAHGRLPAKNTLSSDDARLVEAACPSLLDGTLMRSRLKTSLRVKR